MNGTGTILHDLKKIAELSRKLSEALDTLYLDIIKSEEIEDSIEETSNDKQNV